MAARQIKPVVSQIDTSRRPFCSLDHLLIPDLYLRTIPEIAAPLQWAYDGQLQLELFNRRQAAREDMRILMEAGFAERNLRQMPGRLRIDHADEQIVNIAMNFPAYADAVVQDDLRKRKRELDKFDPQEYGHRKDDWESSWKDIQLINDYQHERAVSRPAQRELELRLKKLYLIDRDMEFFPRRDPRTAPPAGVPDIVISRHKTIVSILRKAFIRGIRRIPEQQAKDIVRLLNKEKDVALISSAMRQPFYDLDFYDASGFTGVYSTLELMRLGIRHFKENIGRYNQAHPETPIAIAQELGAEAYEDYSKVNKKGKLTDAIHIIYRSPTGRSDYVEVHFNTIWNFGTGLFGMTRRGHELYDQQKTWRQEIKINHDTAPKGGILPIPKEWSDWHYAIYDVLAERAPHVFKGHNLKALAR